MDLRLEQLRRVVVLADELNFTRAAARLHVAQQVLSAQVRQVEAALGVPLFARTTRRVELTAQGEAFVAGARVAVTAAEQAVRAAREAGARTQLLLACEIDAQWAVGDVVRAFTAEAPDVDVVVLYFNDPAAVTHLRAGKVDALAVWGAPGSEPEDNEATLAREETYVALRADDPLAPRHTVPVGALRGRTVWMFPRESEPRVWDAMTRHVRAGQRRIEVVPAGAHEPAAEHMLAAVRRHGGMSFVSRRQLQRVPYADVVARPLDPPLVFPVRLQWAPPPSDAVARLAGVAVREAGTRPTVRTTGARPTTR